MLWIVIAFLPLFFFLLGVLRLTFWWYTLFQRSSDKPDNIELKNKPNRIKQKSPSSDATIQESSPLWVGIFHPHAHAGGGGERVLWVLLHSLLHATQLDNTWLYSCLPVFDPTRPLFIALYVSSEIPSLHLLLETVRQQFDIHIPLDNATQRLKLIALPNVHEIDPSRYPSLTLLRQALGSVRLVARGLQEFVPELFLDTTGVPFAYPLVHSFGCRILAYVHYPTLSHDMMDKITKTSANYNHAPFIAHSTFLTFLKKVYYRFLMRLYLFCGNCVTLVLVNSHWTKNHMVEMWKRDPSRVHLIYPPTPIEPLVKLSLIDTHENASLLQKNSNSLSCLSPSSSRGRVTRNKRNAFQILSVGQFRPEKNHALQLRILSGLIPQFPHLKLILLGGTRNELDRKRVQDLQEIARLLKIEAHVEWDLNVHFSQLLFRLQTSAIGLHTMVEEHFGISLVEYMAAGCVVVAHDSGGPRSDIVKPCSRIMRRDLDHAEKRRREEEITQSVGFLAKTEEDYVETLTHVLKLTPGEQLQIRINAREACQRFSQGEFAKSLHSLVNVER